MKAEADFLQSVRAGAIDSAVQVLKRIHDMKQMQAQSRVKGSAPAAVAGVPVAPAMGNVLFSLASAQVQLFTDLLKQQQTVSTTVHNAVRDAIGVPRPAPGDAATQVITWRARRPTDGSTLPAARRRFVVRNAGEAAGITISLRPFTIVAGPSIEQLVGPRATVRVDGRALTPDEAPDKAITVATVAKDADVREGVEGVVAKGATALVEIELDVQGLLDEVDVGRYAAAMTVALARGPEGARALSATQAMTLELVVT